MDFLAGWTISRFNRRHQAASAAASAIGKLKGLMENRCAFHG